MNQRPVTIDRSGCGNWGQDPNRIQQPTRHMGTGDRATRRRGTQGRQIAVIGCGVWGRVPNRIQAVDVGR